MTGPGSCTRTEYRRTPQTVEEIDERAPVDVLALTDRLFASSETVTFVPTACRATTPIVPS